MEGRERPSASRNVVSRRRSAGSVQPDACPAKVLNAFGKRYHHPLRPRTTSSWSKVSGGGNPLLLLSQNRPQQPARFGSTDKILGRHIA